MRSFYLIVIFFFIAICYGQRIPQVDSLYAEFNKTRVSLCLNAISIASDLEKVAQTNADGICTGGPSNINNYLYYTYSTSKTFTKNDLFNYANSIYQVSKGNWNCNSDSSKTGNIGDVMWQRFVSTPIQEVGCAFNSNNCGTKYIFVCTFRNYPFTTPIVPTNKCSGCSVTAAPTVKVTTAPTVKVTTAPTVKVTTAPTVKVTTAPTVKVTTAPTVKVTTAPTVKVTTAPTVKVTTAPTVKVTTSAPTTAAPTTTTKTGDPIKDAFLVPINNARACMGVKELTWNNTLAADAQAWADFSAKSCVSAHSFSYTNPKRVESEQGENIWNFQGSSMTPIQAINLGVEFWNRESIGFVCSTNQCTLSSSPQTVTLSNGFPSTLSTCGHYTQNVWAKSTSIGCAYAICPNVSPTKILGVCRYNPPGNWNSEHPLGGTSNCDKAPGCGAKRSLSVNSQTQTTQTTQNTPKSSSSFFTSGSQVVVFALAIAILVVVVAIIVVLLIGVRKRNTSADYQLMETK